MTFFNTEPDCELPTLTQFFQIAVPANWGDRIYMEKAEEHPLLRSELDRFLLRCCGRGLLPAPKEYLDRWTSEGEEPARIQFYSEQFGESGGLFHPSLSTLMEYANLHFELTGAMRAFVTQGDNDNLTEKGKMFARFIYLLNLRYKKAPLASKIVPVDFALRSGKAQKIYRLAETEKFLETQLLLDFSTAVAIGIDQTGGLGLCPVCESVFVIKRQGQRNCSKRCGDRIAQSAARKRKEEKEE